MSLIISVPKSSHTCISQWTQGALGLELREPSSSVLPHLMVRRARALPWGRLPFHPAFRGWMEGPPVALLSSPFHAHTCAHK